jgi:SAM-dependent methyltransferase
VALLEARSFVVLSTADELVRRPALAAVFAAEFSPGDDATLVVVVDEARVDATMGLLQVALDAAGLEQDALPDVLVLPTPGGRVDPRVGPELAAMLTEEPLPRGLALPRIGVNGASRLAALAGAHHANAALTAGLPAGFGTGTTYVPRIPPDYFGDAGRADHDIVHQPDVYALVAFLAERNACTHVIDVGCGMAQKLVPLAPRFRLIGMDLGPNLEYCRAHHPEHTWIEFDAEREPPPALPASLLRRSIVVCADVIEHLVNPAGLLRTLAAYVEHAPAALLSTPERVLVRGDDDQGPPANPAHVREWALDELTALATAARLEPTFAGLTVDNDRDLEKKTSLLVLESEDRRRIEPAPTEFTVTAVVPAFNEADVIACTLRDLTAQGVHVHLVDNWSTDDTVARAEALGLGDMLTIERFPAGGPSETYDWEDLLRNAERLAAELDTDWVIHQDADEIRRAPWAGVTMRDALHHVRRLGFNAVEYTVLVFRPTSGEDFEPGARSGHFVQVKARDAFEGRRVFPYNFLMLHSPVRSQAHGELLELRDDFARRYLVERLSGIGIRRED